MITLTKQLIDQCETERGGLTNATVHALTGKNRPKKGWRVKLVGTQIEEDRYQKALAGKTQFSKTTLKMRKQTSDPAPINNTLVERVAELESEVGDLKDALEALYKEIYPE